MKKYKRNQNPIDSENYSKLQAKYKKEIIQSKNRAWNEFCSNTQKPFDIAFKIMKDTGNTKRTFFSTLDGMPLDSSNTDIRNKPKRHHYATGVMEEEKNAHHHKFKKITRKEIEVAIGWQNQNKAPVPDKLDSRIIPIVH